MGRSADSVSSTHLNASLAQTEALAELLTHECIRIVGFVEQTLQLVQLLQREISSRSTLFVAAAAATVTASVDAVGVARRVGVLMRLVLIQCGHNAVVVVVIVGQPNG